MNSVRNTYSAGWRLGLWLLALACIAVLPFVFPIVVVTEIFIFAILAVAFNLILGYTGLLSFGQAAFFGLGAYVAGNLLIHYPLHLLLVMVAGTLVGGLAALIVGYMSVRSAALYFVLLTLAFGQMVYFTAFAWTPFTGGDDGLRGIPRPDFPLFGSLSIPLQDPMIFYWFVVVVFLFSYWIFKRIISSPWGLIFMAIRENEDRVAAVGHAVARYKLLSFTISGAMSGLAGVLYAIHWQIVPITTVELGQSANIVFMTLLGGIGHPVGPVIGAAVFTLLSDMAATYWARWPILFGAVVILVVLFLRGGLVEAWQKMVNLLGRQQQKGVDSENYATGD
ncbi:MAG: branched-chain amino acid ABC transporter permease [Nitrospinota bacterium]|nr:MAG: branched-chain amino acid ABC transporter permease [Nitrospinota bacterium]